MGIKIVIKNQVAHLVNTRMYNTILKDVTKNNVTSGIINDVSYELKNKTLTIS